MLVHAQCSYANHGCDYDCTWNTFLSMHAFSLVSSLLGKGKVEPGISCVRMGLISQILGEIRYLPYTVHIIIYDFNLGSCSRKRLERRDTEVFEALSEPSLCYKGLLSVLWVPCFSLPAEVSDQR